MEGGRGELRGFSRRSKCWRFSRREMSSGSDLKCVCVCVCVCERERERELELSELVSVVMCACVCELESVNVMEVCMWRTKCCSRRG